MAPKSWKTFEADLKEAVGILRDASKLKEWRERDGVEPVIVAAAQPPPADEVKKVEGQGGLKIRLVLKGPTAPSSPMVGAGELHGLGEGTSNGAGGA